MAWSKALKEGGNDNNKAPDTHSQTASKEIGLELVSCVEEKFIQLNYTVGPAKNQPLTIAPMP